MSRKPTTHELEALIAAHAAEIAALKAENEKLAQRVLHLEEQLRLERLHRYAPKSEKLKERIFNEAEQAAAESRDDDDVEAVAVPDTGLPEAPKPAPKTRGRKPLPDDLPRQRVEHDLGEDQKDCPCCHNRMHRMGETVTEQLHVEVKASVLQHVRFKYACRHCERTALNTPIVTAPMPAQPLPGRCRHAIDAGAGARQQIRRRHAAVPCGGRAGARRRQHQPRHAGQLGDPGERVASASGL
jgi:hypothetical protein